MHVKEAYVTLYRAVFLPIVLLSLSSSEQCLIHRTAAVLIFRFHRRKSHFGYGKPMESLNRHANCSLPIAKCRLSILW